MMMMTMTMIWLYKSELSSCKVSPSERFVFSEAPVPSPVNSDMGIRYDKNCKNLSCTQKLTATWCTASEKMQHMLKSVPLSPVLAFMPPPVISHRRHFVLELSMRLSVRVWSPHTRSLYAIYLTNHSREFHQKCNFGEVRHRHEPVGFWDQKVKGQGHSKITNGQIHTFRDISSPISGKHGLILTKFITVTNYQVHTTLMTFSRSGV